MYNLFWILILIFSKQLFQFDNGLWAIIDKKENPLAIGVIYISTGGIHNENENSYGLSYASLYSVYKKLPEKFFKITKNFKLLLHEDYFGFQFLTSKKYLKQAISILFTTLKDTNIDSLLIKEIQQEIYEIYKTKSSEKEIAENYARYIRYGFKGYGLYPFTGDSFAIYSITPEKLKVWKNIIFSANNSIISIAGNIDNIKELKEFLEEESKKLPQKPRPSKPLMKFFSPGIKKIIVPEIKNYALIVIGKNPSFYRGYIEKLASVLIITKILEKKGLNIKTKFLESSGFWEVKFICKKDEIKKYYQNLLQILNGIKEKGLSDEEIENVKKELYKEFALRIRSNLDITLENAMPYVFDIDENFRDKIIQTIKMLPKSTIEKVFKKYFSPENLMFILLIPEQT